MEPRATYRDRRLSRSYWPADTSRPLLEWTLGDALRAAAAVAPERWALVEGRADPSRSRRWTYAQLLSRSERVATALLEKFRPGERVGFWAANEPEWMLAFYGCALAGIVMVTVNPAYKAAEMRHVLGKSEAAGLFAMDAYRGYDALAAIDSVRGALPHLREVIRIADFDAVVDSARGDTPLPRVAPLDPCVIMFTSGTTGEQKGAIFHHKGVINMSLFTQERGGLAVGGVFVNPMPMFHIGALGHAGVGAVMRCATHVLAAEWDAKLFMSLVARERGQYSLLVPTMIEAMLAHPERDAFDLSTLKNLVSGASVVEASLIRRAHAELGCTICNIFGQTEMQGVVTGVHRDDDERDQNLAARRLASIRRSGLDGLARIPQNHWTHQGHDHPRRREHLSSRNRKPAARTPGGGDGGRRRRTRRLLGRAGRRGDPAQVTRSPSLTQRIAWILPLAPRGV